MTLSRDYDQRGRNVIIAVVLGGIAVVGIFITATTYTHTRQEDVIERSILRNDLPNLLNSVTHMTEAFFDKFDVGVTLLAQRADWKERFAAAFSEPETMHEIRERAATVMGASDVSVVDLRRNLMYTFWTREPLELDPNSERDAWYYEIYKRADPPEERFIMYYDEQLGNHVGYFDRLIRDELGTPIGVIGVAIDLEALAATVQESLSPQDRIVFCTPSSATPVMEIEHGTPPTPLGDVYVPEGVTASQKREYSILSSYRSELELAESTPFITADSRYVADTVDLSIDDLTAHVFLSTETRLKLSQSVYQRDSRVTAVAIVALLAAYISMVAYFTHYSRKRIGALDDLRTRHEDLLSILGHNLLNNVHSIRGNVERPEIDRARVLSAVNDMEHVVRNSVYLTMIDDTHSKSDMYPITISSVVGRVERVCRPVVAAKNQRTVVESEERDATVSSDGELLYHILLNLIDNAIKYSPPGSKVWLLTTQADRYVECFIGDQGPGFSQDDRMLLFTKFQRLSARPTTGERSTGIGLYATKRLCDSIGITIELVDDIPQWCRRWVNENTGAMWLLRVPSKGEAASESESPNTRA